MYRLLALALLVLSLSGCGGTLCERADSAMVRMFGGRPSCLYSEGGQTLGLVRREGDVDRCESNLSQCTAEDLKLLESYVQCTESVPVCTKGKERDSVMATLSCGAVLLDESNQPKLSAQCLKVFSN